MVTSGVGEEGEVDRIKGSNIGGRGRAKWVKGVEYMVMGGN